MPNYVDIANSHPKLKRNMVWCSYCGRMTKIFSAICLAEGWPKCCGYTMTLDSPEERNELTK